MVRLTSHDRQKALEAFYAGEFLKRTGWNYPLVPREAPDFLMTTPSGKIGLEITFLFKDESRRGSLYKQRERKKSLYLEQVAAAYYGMGGRPLYVTANFSNWDLDEQLIPHIARRLVRRRPATVPGNTAFEVRTPHYRNVAKLYLTALMDAAGPYSRWRCVENAVGTVRPIDDGVLQGKIEEKADKLMEYQKAAAKTILLIVAEGTQDSGMFHFTSGTPVLSACGFEEVHVMLYPQETRRIA